jgi:hypothetical protein
MIMWIECNKAFVKRMMATLVQFPLLEFDEIDTFQNLSLWLPQVHRKYALQPTLRSALPSLSSMQWSNDNNSQPRGSYNENGVVCKAVWDLFYKSLLWCLRHYLYLFFFQFDNPSCCCRPCIFVGIVVFILDFVFISDSILLHRKMEATIICEKYHQTQWKYHVRDETEEI